MKKKRVLAGGHNVSGVFVFFLIGLFALASITLVLTGVQVYSRVTKTAADNTERQISLSYLLNKIHAYDHTGGIRLDIRDGIQVLCLLEDIDGEGYETQIYYYDGSICEQFSAAGEEFHPDYGEQLTNARALQFFAVTPNLLQVNVTLSDGSEQTMNMGLRSAQVR